MTIIIDAFLIIALAAAWLGTAGFARLRAPLDRVHCISFVNAVAGAALTIAAFLADGASDRALKILVIFVVNLLSGAAISHMTGRAITQRETAA